jgi:Flp pilus assembly protein TadG
MRLKSQSGQALVEIALVLPLLLIIIFGVIEFSILLYDKAVITNASREGARHGIVAPNPRPSVGDITNAVNAYCAANLITFGGSGSLSVTAPEAAASTIKYFGDPLTVTVTYTYTFFVLPKFILTNGSLTLHATTLMKYE